MKTKTTDPFFCALIGAAMVGARDAGVKARGAGPGVMFIEAVQKPPGSCHHPPRETCTNRTWPS